VKSGGLSQYYIDGLFDKEGVKDENDITTDSSNDSEPDFDSCDDEEFDPILGNDL
jgi:hypothetical protein